MGIPKFFRWISERYPMCSQMLTDRGISEFDNLYLDMNGIIHNCAYNNDTNTHFRIPEDQIWINIFNYIDHLVLKIKPKKLLFLAIDGVAPRAKMNQQRSRRFRTARLADELRQIALDRGEKITEKDTFDSNCITPGTTFMRKLTTHLRYFISKKVSEDMCWRDMNIVLSGPDVPGEGEHKIMEYIRLARAQPTYDPNTRHCLYGLDADLIMLGLLSHDPHFALLREEVTFGKPKQTSLTTQNFFLMHLSIMREYLDLEFRELAESLSFPYDFERILDDFILMSLFVGNDFLPNLPGLHIHEGALGLMFKIYKDTLPTCDGYIQDGGKVDMTRLQKILNGISDVVESATFEWETMDTNGTGGDSNTERRLLEQLETREREQTLNKLVITERQCEIFRQVNDRLQGKSVKKVTLQFNERFQQRDKKFLNLLADELNLACDFDHDVRDHSTYVGLTLYSDIEESDESDESTIIASRNRVLKKYTNAQVIPEGSTREKYEKEQKEKFEAKLEQWKADYYQEKMGVDYYDSYQMDRLVGSYVTGIQWVLKYYYEGVASWSWFYPYHYAPKITDLKHIGRFADFEFAIDKPFEPFEQLMAVLPSLSRKLLPTAYQDLMTDPRSPIIDFYPVDFEIDKNGKKQDWEAIVKIPFIDTPRLLAAMEERKGRLTREEWQRTQMGQAFIYTFDNDLHNAPKEVVPSFQSTLHGVFPDIKHCYACEEPYVLFPLGSTLRLKKTLLDGARVGIDASAGFPSLQTLPFTYAIEKCGVHVFNHDSPNESIAITLQNNFAHANIEQVAKSLLYKCVYVHYPYLQEAVVLGVSNAEKKYYVTPRHERRQIMEHLWDEEERAAWQHRITRSEYMLKKRFALDIGSIEVGVHVCTVVRMHQTDEGALIKEFTSPQTEELLPIQMVVTRVRHPDARFTEQPAPPVSDFFPLHTSVFFLGNSFSGAQATIVGYTNDRVDIEIITPVDGHQSPGFGHTIVQREEHEVTYKSGLEISRELQISPLVLSRITSAWIVMDESVQRVNVGLNLKFDQKGEKVIGYSRKHREGYWEFSSAAFSLIQQFCAQFPDFVALLAGQRQHMISYHDLVGGNDAILHMRDWLKSKGVERFERVAVDTQQLSKEYCRYVEEAGAAFDQDYTRLKFKKVFIRGIPRGALLRPCDAELRLYYQTFSLGDRVVYVSESGTVPLGYKGTVVGLQSTAIDVIFDISFLGGGTLGGRCSNGLGMTLPLYSVLNTSMSSEKTEQPVNPEKKVKSQDKSDRTNRGRDNTNRERDNTNRERDNTNRGYDNTYRGRDNTNRGYDNTNRGNQNHSTSSRTSSQSEDSPQPRHYPRRGRGGFRGNAYRGRDWRQNSSSSN